MARVNVLVVDDEPVARRGLRRQLAELPGITCIGECGGIGDAVTAIVEQNPDVVLLDVQLGRSTAFEIIEEIGVDAMPLVVFVTAYDRHALRAFEVHALDYVLKPVDPERLKDALDRAGKLLDQQRGSPNAERLASLLDQQAPRPDAASRQPQRFVVRDGPRLMLLEPAQIDWFDSDGNYVKVHAGGRVFTMRITMDRIEQRLAGNASFVRVRRAAIVNIRAIATLERYGKGTFHLRLRDGTIIISGRHYLANLRKLLS